MNEGKEQIKEGRSQGGSKKRQKEEMAKGRGHYKTRPYSIKHSHYNIMFYYLRNSTFHGISRCGKDIAD